MRPRAVVFGCAGSIVTEAERQFFREAGPAGFILFRRNVESPAQVQALVRDLRDAVGRTDAPILIDQEGGRVARLGPPHWRVLPPARVIGSVAERELMSGLMAARSAGRIIGAMLADLGIDVACAPVADLLLPETNAVIGDRAYSADPALVGLLASAMSEGLADAGVTAIMKHIPGHGRATTDSHLALPRIDTPSEALLDTDFAAFRAILNAPWAMVAHCVYSEIDPSNPASTSQTVIANVIRGTIGFDGVLIADDIRMKALEGSLAENAAATLAAGCDLTLHCSGDLDEMEAVAAAVAPITDAAADRLERGRIRRGGSPFDRDEARALLDRLVRA